MERKTHVRTGIYKVTNIITKDFYIGATANIYYRIKNHQWTLKNERHGNSKMQKDALIHGCESFVYDVLEFCEPIDRDTREQYFIDLLKPTYNKWTSVKIPAGYKHTEEAVKKMKANRSPVKDEAARREKLKASWVRSKENGTFNSRMRHMDQTGRMHSDETKSIIGAASKKNWNNPEFREKMIKIRKNRGVL